MSDIIDIKRGYKQGYALSFAFFIFGIDPLIRNMTGDPVIRSVEIDPQSNLDKFNKGGNCKLQGWLFIFIEKFSNGIFNTGGNCKLQLPQMKGVCLTLQFLQMKIVLVIPHPPLRCLNERKLKGRCGKSWIP